MAVTTSDVPQLLLPGLRAEFATAYHSQLDNSVADQIATVINTTQPLQRYAWLGAPPAMREFLDERVPQGLGSYAMTIEDKTFEATIAVDRRAIEDDQLDLIRLRVRDLASRVVTHRHQLLVQTIVAGATEAGPDGVSFFNTAHPVGGTTVSNRTSVALSAEALAEGMSAMMLVPDEAGVPLGTMPDTLLVGPALQWSAMELVQSPVVVYRGNANDTAPSTPYQNVLQGRLRVVVSPFLNGASAQNWYLLDTSRPVRPFILQQRSDVPIEFAALDSSTGAETAFMRDQFLYGVRGRYNAGYGLWQSAYGGIS